MATRLPLPIDDVLPALVEALRASPAVVLEAPPGAGKSTRVPPALLDAGLSAGGVLLMLEPRRAAARAVARRLAEEAGEPVGETWGYQVRFEGKRSARTRGLVVTEGILTRRFAADAFLEGVSCVVLDEFHERSVHVDLALAFLKELLAVRDDLRVVVMSATLDADGVAAWLGGCPVVRCPGRVHPLSVRHAGPRDKAAITEGIVAACRSLLAAGADDGGDVLAFLPGAAEIHRAQRALADARLPGSPELVPLYGALPAAEQDRALSPGRGRRIVLATNIAETSLTLPRVTAVVDSGWEKALIHDPQRGMDRLELTPISRASATQRAGRAGRTAPGRVVRLWSEAEHAYLPEAAVPELLRVDLATVLLQVLAFQPGDPRAFPFFDAPQEAAVDAGLSLLRALGAVEARGFALTPLGERLGSLPVHPRLGAVLLRAAALQVGEDAALAAALLEERDLLRRGAEAPTAPSDLGWRLEVFHRLEAARFDEGEARRWGADLAVARGVARARDQLRRALPEARRGRPPEDPDAALRRALLAGYPDRVCRRRRPGAPEAAMVGGTGVRLAEGSAVREAEIFLALDVEAGRRGERSSGLVRLASAVDADWLAEDLPHLTADGVEAVFDGQTEAVVGRRVRRFADLVLSEGRGARVEGEAVAAALAEAALGQWDRVFRPDGAGLRLLQRLRFAGAALPDEGWPDVSDEALKAWLPELCVGRRSFADLVGLSWVNELRGRLPWAKLAALDEVAPDRLEVPSGSHIEIDYGPALGPGGAPVLAVRLQELFGLRETPVLARGRVPVLLHLLSPGFKPVQVTRDLRSFWDTTYAEVRKELRQRYPKHSWPVDPWTAEAVRGARRRRSGSP